MIFCSGGNEGSFHITNPSILYVARHKHVYTNIIKSHLIIFSMTGNLLYTYCELVLGSSKFLLMTHVREEGLCPQKGSKLTQKTV